MRTSNAARLGLLCLALAPGADVAAQPPPTTMAAKVIDLRNTQPPPGNSFEAMWGAYEEAEARSDKEGGATVLKEIEKLRVERNVRNLESLALAAVARGTEQLAEGQRDPAEAHFRLAMALAPSLPDGYLALARASMKRGILGLPGAARWTASGLIAHLGSARGWNQFLNLLVPAGLLTLFLSVTILAVALLCRHGALLLHDIEEALGNRRPMALGVFGALLLLPSIVGVGPGWLPWWWLAALFAYMTQVERILVGVGLLSVLVAGPAVSSLESRINLRRNDLYLAGLQTYEAAGDSRVAGLLESAAADDRKDRDYRYMLAVSYKKAGRYEEAADILRAMLAEDPKDHIALNNFANLDFVRGDFAAAITRYQAALATNPASPVMATLYYNLSLAQYQKFDYQPAQESRSKADLADSAITRTYDSTWKYEGGLNAVVDIALDPPQLEVKFGGRTPEENLAGTGRSVPGTTASLGRALISPAAAIPVIFAMVAGSLIRWRGPRALTGRCLKCGAAFCKRCHIAVSQAGLCSQCHHMFVVRDGVSGPARKQKLQEVEAEEVRRDRLFRALSLLLPGSGLVYGRKTVAGVVFITLWSALMSLALLGGNVVPFTEASASLARPLGLGVVAALLLAVYVLANRARPDFEVAVVAPRRSGAGASRRPAPGRAS